MFSQEGGDIQSKIHELILNHLNWNGNREIIDIGCGNAPLIIKAAKRYPNAFVTGIDYWGGMWEYSINMCWKMQKLKVLQIESPSRKPQHLIYHS